MDYKYIEKLKGLPLVDHRLQGLHLGCKVNIFITGNHTVTGRTYSGYFPKYILFHLGACYLAGKDKCICNLLNLHKRGLLFLPGIVQGCSLLHKTNKLSSR